MAVKPNLPPTHYGKNLGIIKAERTVKHITFNPSEANPGKTLYHDVSVARLNESEVIVPRSLALRFNPTVSGQPNNFLVQNVSQALVDKYAVKFAGAVLQEAVGYDIFKIFEHLLLSEDEREDMLLEGIQSDVLSKIRSNASDKKPRALIKKKSSTPFTATNTTYSSSTIPDPKRSRCFSYPQALYSDMGCLPFTWKTRKFQLENQMVRIIPF